MNFGNLFLAIAAIISQAGSIPQKFCTTPTGEIIHVPSCAEETWVKGGVELQEGDGTKTNWYTLLPADNEKLNLMTDKMQEEFKTVLDHANSKKTLVSRGEAITALEKAIEDYCNSQFTKESDPLKNKPSLSYNQKHSFEKKKQRPKNLHHSRGR